MNIGWPQGILLALVLVEVGVFLANHGEPRPDYNFGAKLLDAATLLGLLWWGGFFS